MTIEKDAEDIIADIKQALESGATEVAFFIKENTPVTNLRAQFFSKESGEKGPKLSVYHGTKVDDTMKNENVKYLALAAMFLALAYVMPFLTGQIPQIGSMLCPMHIPVLLCGFFCGRLLAEV